MEISFFCESRDYLRVKADVPVRYRFSSDRLEHATLEHEFEGASCDLSGGGLLLRGPLPDESWIPDLLMERITLDVSVYLPDAHEPVNARARIAWLDAGKDPGESTSGGFASFGLKFVEIAREDQDRIFQYILEDFLP